MTLSVLPPHIRDVVINTTLKNSGESKSNVVAGKMVLTHVLAIPYQIIVTLSTCYAYYVKEMENLIFLHSVMVKILLKFGSFRGESLKDKFAAVQIFMEYMIKGNVTAMEAYNIAVNNVNKKHYLLSGLNNMNSTGNNNPKFKNRFWNGNNNNTNDFNNFPTEFRTTRSFRGKFGGPNTYKNNSNRNNGTNNRNKKKGNKNGLQNNPTLEDYNAGLPENQHVCTGSSCTYRNCSNRAWWNMNRSFYN